MVGPSCYFGIVVSSRWGMRMLTWCPVRKERDRDTDGETEKVGGRWKDIQREIERETEKEKEPG